MILRDLWRRRILVGCAALLAVLAGTAVAYRISFPPKLESRKYEVGVATTRILVDTPSSQVVEVAPKGSDTLGVRANLLASLMVDGVVKTAIARRAGLRPDQLEGAGQNGAPPKGGPRANVLTARVLTNTVGLELPIIEIGTQSPDPAQAARLANAAVAGLRDYLDSQAAVEKVPNASRLRVSGLGAAQARQAVRGPKRVVALAATILVFLTLNGLILASIALIRGWRAAAEEDESLEGAEPRDDERLDPSARESAWPAERSSGGPWGRRTSPALTPPTSAGETRTTVGVEPRAKSA
jgi:hypothetical protein